MLKNRLTPMGQYGSSGTSAPGQSSHQVVNPRPATIYKQRKSQVAKANIGAAGPSAVRGSYPATIALKSPKVARPVTANAYNEVSKRLDYNSVI